MQETASGSSSTPCTNPKANPGEKNAALSLSNSFPKASGAAAQASSSNSSSPTSPAAPSPAANGSSSPPEASNSNTKTASSSSSTSKSSSSAAQNSQDSQSSQSSEDYSNVGSDSSQDDSSANSSNDSSNSGSGKASKPPRTTTDARGIIRDQNGEVVGIKTVSTSYGSGRPQETKSYKPAEISTSALSLPKNLVLPKISTPSQNVFDPELTTGYQNFPYGTDKTLHLTSDEKKILAQYNSMIASSVASNQQQSTTECRPAVFAAKISSGDHGARIHTTPQFDGASFGVAANREVLSGYYVSSGWFRITSGRFQGGYVSRALLVPSSQNAANGQLDVSKLARVPNYLRRDPSDSASEYLQPTAARQLLLLNAAYRSVFGENLKLNEAYRPLSTQQEYWKSLPEGVAAKPGTSNHGFALAVDFDGVVFGSEKDRWMSLFSQGFGWDRPSYFDRAGSERWHYNFVG